MAYVWFWSPVPSCAGEESSGLSCLSCIPACWTLKSGPSGMDLFSLSLVSCLPGPLLAPLLFQIHLYSYAKILRVIHAATV